MKDYNKIFHPGGIMQSTPSGVPIPENLFSPDDTSAVAAFCAMVYSFYATHGRKLLPWRLTDDPYAVMVSEIMLQQTQVDRVVPKYTGFMDLFPDIASLAQSPFQKVLAAWQGLGYNRRALALHNLARQIVSQYDGRIPDTPDLLKTLPGIGPYTACAVCTFAFNQPHVFIETNIRSVFIHYWFDPDATVRDAHLLPLIEKTLDTHQPRLWYYALMDLGAALKRNRLNPSRRSTHYTKQSRFEGSNRQVRGMILKLLTGHGSMHLDAIINTIGRCPKTVATCLSELTREGFVAIDDAKYRIV